MPLLPTRRWWLGLLAAAVLLVALFDVAIVYPRIHVRWRPDVAEAQRRALEEKYELARGVHVQGETWRYEMRDRSEANVAALIRDSAVRDTAYIDRPTLSVPSPDVRVTATGLRALAGPTPAALIQPQTLVLLALGGLLLFAARLDERRRRTATLVLLGAAAVGAYALPLDQPLRMGDSHTYTRNRDAFEHYTGVRQIRYEAHLSHALLGRIDALLGRTEDAPGRAMAILMHAATAWFLLCALAVGVIERWSPQAVRYLGLMLLSPAALLFFGFRELGHLSLNVAAYPLLARGVRQGGAWLETSGALAGFGTALHGFGLLSVAGSSLAVLAARVRPVDRVRSLLRFLPWGVALYLGWVAIYVILLKLPIVAGHAESIPLRPLWVDSVGERINAAIFSARGARDTFFTFWIAGVPVLAVALSLWRTHRDLVNAAVAYTVPSILFLAVFWPIQGLAVELDLVFAAFPAFYALAWVCALDARCTMAAAALLASGHLAFWRVALDTAFVNSPIG